MTEKIRVLGSDVLLANLMQGYAGLVNYWIVILLMMTGFYIVIGQRNLIKSIIGLNIFQTSVFLLYITMGKVRGGTAPIIQGDPHATDHSAHGDHAAAIQVDDHAAVHATQHENGHVSEVTQRVVAQAGEHPIDHASDHPAGEGIEHASDQFFEMSEVVYSNPLPSVLMLTAIVVGIATTALALALIVRIREDYGTIEEDEILDMDRLEDIEAAKLPGTA